MGLFRKKVILEEGVAADLVEGLGRILNRLAEVHYAAFLYGRLREQILEHLAATPDGRVLSVYAITPSGEKRVLDLGFHNPDMLILQCIDGTGQCRLLTHVGCVQLLLRFEAVDNRVERRQIGFLGEEPRPAAGN